MSTFLLTACFQYNPHCRVKLPRESEHLVSVVDASPVTCHDGDHVTRDAPPVSPEVQLVPGHQGPVPRGQAEDDPGGAAVEESHGAHVTRLPGQVHRAASQQIPRTWC